MRKPLQILLLSMLLGLGIFKVPKPFTSLTDKYSNSKVILDSEGQLLRMTLDQQQIYREKVSFNNIPKKYIELLLKKEDRFFFYHLGVNPVSLIRSFFYSYLLKSTTSGASTITMQLARLHYDLKTKTPTGKIAQVIAATYLELIYSKNEILEAYANLAPFGRNIEGIGAAARIYFQKDISQITDIENLFLVSLPQRPGVLNDHNKFGPVPKELSISMNLISDFKVKANDLWIHSIQELPFKAPHAVWQAINRFNIQTKSIINTTINPRSQALLTKTLKSYLQRNKENGLQNAAAMIVNYESMEVEALIGSKDYFDDKILGQVDGTISKRSPGSTLKPLAYAMAMERGIIHPHTILMDAPLAFRTPENFDQKFMGPMSATDALIQSRNVPAVWLTSKLKRPSVYDQLNKLEVRGLKHRNHYGTSIILGGVELSMWELANIYTMFANNGLMKKIKLLKNDREQQATRILKEESTTLVLDMLKENPRPGFDTRFSTDNSWPVYWKTGTSFGFRDAWSVGITGPYVVLVWAGNFNGESHPSLIGAKAAAPLFFEIIDSLKNASHEMQKYYFAYSDNLTEVEVCATSGEMPTEHCHHKVKTNFWPGVSPIGKCQLHRSIKVSSKTGLRACSKTFGKIDVKTIEVWPTHLMKLFTKLGIPRKAPPAWGNECKINDKTDLGRDPQILSPKIGVNYNIRMNSEHKKIHLLAQTDSDVKQVYWYLGSEYLGKTIPNKSFFWKAKAGNYLVKLVDDRGRIATRELNVILTQ